MGLAEIQAALARLSVDPALRRSVLRRSDGCRCRAGARFRRVPKPGADLHGSRSKSSPNHFGSSGGPRFAGRFRWPRGRLVVGLSSYSSDYALESTPRGSKADLDDAVGFVAALRPMGRSDRASLGHRPGPLRAGLAAGDARRANTATANLPLPRRSVGDRPGRGSGLAPVDSRILVETQPWGKRSTHHDLDAEPATAAQMTPCRARSDR